MAEEIRHPDGRIEHPSVRHEGTDASFRAVLSIVIGAAVLGAVILLGIRVYFHHAKDALAAARKSHYPLAGKPSKALPPEPRLEQLDRLADISGAAVRQKARADILNSFGPTEDKDFIHIPIERALRLLADKLPARSEMHPTPRDNGLVNGGASNSGRLFNKRTPRWFGP